MKKIELLSPVGNKESLYMAIHAGADAVYLSGKKYGARKFANNFTEEELIEAIKYCHLYDVKIYVTINTLIFEDEIEDFLEYAKFLYINNVDAVIVQDIGMINLLREQLPDLEIHASTQTHNYNVNTTKMYKDLGVKRVVLARELSIEEIEQHSRIMDTEVFIHGALCMSYSGCCYMSLLRGSRSGNRGECAGTCRLQYKLDDKEKTEKYILSTKDLCNINDIDKIIESEVVSLKIEGRMKSKEYVYLTTKLYREVIDNYYKTKKVIINEQLLSDIRKVFNRDYTRGHKFNSLDIMNEKRPNHQGILLGQVVKTDKKFITIKLSNDLIIGDGIKFINTDTGFTVTNILKNGIKVKEAQKNEIVSVPNTIMLNEKSSIVKTTDKKLIDSLSHIEEKKLDITCEVNVIDKSISVIYKYKNQKFEIKKDIVEVPKNINTTKEEIIKQLSKLGNTVYKINEISVNSTDNIYINIKELNGIRRELIESINNYRQNTKILPIPREQHNNYIFKKDETLEINLSLMTKKQYEIVKELEIDNIYTQNYDLYKEYENENLYYIMPRISIKDVDAKNILVNDYNYIDNHNKIGNYYLNITNTKSCEYAYKNGITKICVSPDLNMENLNKILNKNKNINFEVQLYGALEAMITKNNINYNGSFSNNNYKYKILNYDNYTSIITESKNNTKNIKEYMQMGIRKYRIDFIDEDPNEIKRIISQVKKEFKEILPF